LLVGLKSRGCYDTPGLTIARLAHIDLGMAPLGYSPNRLGEKTVVFMANADDGILTEGLVMDSKVRELRDQFITVSWSRQLYNGMYFTPEREFVENSIIFSQQNVTGKVRSGPLPARVNVLGFPCNVR
jgi:argininosuccinate synthase